MVYKNQVLVLVMGMKGNFDNRKDEHTKLSISDSKIYMQNRRKTLKVGNAVRIKRITQDTIIESCTVILEGTLTKRGIEPFSNHGVFAYISRNSKVDINNRNHFTV